MNELTRDTLEKALTEAGFEIYRIDGAIFRIAERVRIHLMDSGVRVSLDAEPRILLTVRTQRSDFPTALPGQLFDKVRQSMSPLASSRGFAEVAAATRNVTDPVDEANVLDVWHELTYAKSVADLEALLVDLRWALEQPKCVT